MTEPEPELEDGAEEEPRLLELDDPELDVPELDVPELELPEADLPVEPEVPEVLEVLEPEVPDAEVELLCADAGRLTATAPAAITPAMPVPTVTARSRFRARSRASTAVMVRPWCSFIRVSPSAVVNTMSMAPGNLAGLG